MSTKTQCPQCKKELPPGAPAGLCPDCLTQAMNSETIPPQPQAAFQLDLTMSQCGAQTNVQHDSLPAGSRLGTFLLEQKLGEGGMGSVYAAFDEATKRTVALKVLKHKLDSPEARKRFLREGQTAASVNHPNCVYVFGTDNIDGDLIIAMELVGQGNLQEVVQQNGALPPNKAVDSILQIVDGLEAAAKVGVLHRDIKPANCFVDEQGDVKIGDFGLSISTIAEEDTLITQENTILGTPAFASPEQLRGDDLDVRSDIYSVGVTLFYLATGELPFTADNMVQLIATVLEKPAPLASSANPKVPSGLGKVIARCMAKNPTERFRDYAELREALSSYSSEAPEPGALPARFVAGCIDSLVTDLFKGGVAMGLAMMWASSSVVRGVSLSIAIPTIYFLLTEGSFGRSFGKAICGLQVIDDDGQKPRFLPVVFRTCCFVLLPAVIYSVYSLLAPSELAGSVLSKVVSATGIMVVFSMFALARRHNGFAALHDWVSGTRVIQRPTKVVDLSLPVSSFSASTTKSEETIGPYHVLKRLKESDGLANVLAYDRRLLRKVWIREGKQTEISPERRAVNRPGRLRWLNGIRDGEHGWDAYEAVEGQPLLKLTEKQQPWVRVRAWLQDLSSELNRNEQERLLPDEIGLGHVWVASDGSAKLLDFRAADVDDDESELYKLAEAGGPQALLRELADRSVGGKGNRHQALPRHAHEIIESLNESTPLPSIQGKLHEVRKRPPKVTRSKRWLMFGLSLAIPVLLALVVGAISPIWTHWTNTNPMMNVFIFASLSDNLEKDASNSTADISQTLELRQFIAAKFGPFVRDTDRWNDNAVIRALNRQKDVRETAEKIVDRYSDAKLEEVEKGREAFSHLILDHPESMPENEATAANLATCVNVVLQHDDSSPMELQLLKVYLADEYGDVIQNEESWDTYIGKNLVKPRLRERLKSYIVEAANASPQDIERAHEKYDGIANLAMSSITPVHAYIVGANTFLLCCALPALGCALLFRKGFLMLLFQLDCVTKDGKPAERGRMILRAMFWGLPALGLRFGLTMYKEGDSPWVGLGLVFVCCLLPLWSLVMMRRSLPDMMASTWLVPR